MRRLLPRTRLARGVATVSLALTLAVLVFFAWQGLRGPERAPDTASIGGPFRLTDQFGAVRTEADFGGRFMLVFFGYTYCPDVCPTVLQAMGATLDELGAAGEKVTPVFITVDPARDTVAQLRAYAANFHPRLVALTGGADEIAAAARAYRVYFAPSTDAADYTMDHSSIVYLMGPDGAFVAHFTPAASAEEMAATIRKYL